MTQYNFNRKYQLTVSQRKTETRPIPNDYTDTPLDDGITFFSATTDYRAVNTQINAEFTDLHMEADINGSNKSAGSKGHQAHIKLYNLNKRSRDLVSQVNNYVILNAGYETEGDDLPLVFTGQIQDAYTKKEGQDRVTHLLCNDGWTPSNSIRVSFRILKGSPYSAAFQYIAKAYRDNGVATGKLILDQSPTLLPLATNPPSSTISERGTSFSGYASEVMDDLCKQFNYNWQIVNNQLFVHPYYYKDMIGIVEISSSGIISIEEQQNGTATPSSESENRGVIITILCNGRVSTEKRLRVLDGERSGDYNIDSVSHKLSYEGQNWYTIIEATGGG